jgi:inner membrane protein
MHIQTHILSGWCIANCFPCTPRQRLFAMLAASAADIDGVSFFFGQEAYWTYHHTFGHNVFTRMLISATLAALIPGRRAASFLLFFALFHLHLVMDYFGSGPEWHIHYLWPLKAMVIKNPHAWEFFSWQNMAVFGFFLIWTLWIIRSKHRTPLEAIMPRLDCQLAGLARVDRRRGFEVPPAVANKSDDGP